MKVLVFSYKMRGERAHCHFPFRKQGSLTKNEIFATHCKKSMTSPGKSDDLTTFWTNFFWYIQGPSIIMPIFMPNRLLLAVLGRWGGPIPTCTKKLNTDRVNSAAPSASHCFYCYFVIEIEEFWSKFRSAISKIYSIWSSTDGGWKLLGLRYRFESVGLD